MVKPHNVKPAKKTFKRITPDYLHNSGLYYLQRFAASSEGFRAVMRRKIQKSCACHPDQNFEKCAALLDDLIAKFIRAGLINDQAFAEGMVASLRRQGKSKRAILVKLKNKGIESDFTNKILKTFDADWKTNDAEPETHAARLFAKKKKLGPFARADKERNPKKDLAAFARAGFPYDVARKALALTNDDEFI